MPLNNRTEPPLNFLAACVFSLATSACLTDHPRPAAHLDPTRPDAPVARVAQVDVLAERFTLAGGDGHEGHPGAHPPARAAPAADGGPGHGAAHSGPVERSPAPGRPAGEADPHAGHGQQAGGEQAAGRPGALDAGSPRATPAAGAALFTCPMHPEVVSDTPGTCPKCGMRLVPRAKPPTMPPGMRGHDGHDGGPH